jgi:hypothetical protein
MHKKFFIMAVAVLVLVLSGKAQALEVISPYVVKGEFELENQGLISHDRDPAASNAQSHVVSLGISPTDWWRAEVESEFARNPGAGQDIYTSSYNLENTFQLAEPGEYWIDPGAFAEIDFGQNGQANNAIFGLLAEKSIGHIEETANLLLHKDFGGTTGVTPLGLSYSDQTKYRLSQYFEPGFEVYGDTDGKEKFADQQFSAGPGLFGKIPTFNGQAFKYQLAYLFGATPATADATVRWKLEYEFYF